MRTVFVNPSRRRRKRRHNPKRRRRAHRRRNSAVQLANPRRRRRRRRNAGVVPFVQNPMILSNPRRRRRRRNPGGAFFTDMAYILGGTIGGAALNRLAFNAINNFYVRNGARVASAALLAYVGGRNTLTAAAAGAALAPMVPDLELLISHSGAAPAGTKNPRELAAELSALLEADLSDDELSDDEVSDDQLEAELSDDLIDDDLIDDDLEDISSMKW